jgi:transcriptional regulator with XRE-family HTH domain
MVKNNDLGKLLRQRRIAAGLTLQKLSDKTDVTPSHLWRIEKAQRYPSGQILQQIAAPLGFGEYELFVLAGYLSPRGDDAMNEANDYSAIGRLDTVVANMLSQETVEVQRSVLSILNMMKSIACSMNDNSD